MIAKSVSVWQIIDVRVILRWWISVLVHTQVNGKLEKSLDRVAFQERHFSDK